MINATLRDIENDKEITSYFINNKYANKKHYDDNNKLGNHMFKCCVSYGLPVEMQVDILIGKYNFPKDKIACAILVYQSLIIYHKLKSGMLNDKITKIQKQNRKVMKSFINLGEMP